jgi:hypothetical protein
MSSVLLSPKKTVMRKEGVRGHVYRDEPAPIDPSKSTSSPKFVVLPLLSLIKLPAACIHSFSDEPVYATNFYFETTTTAFDYLYGVKRARILGIYTEFRRSPSKVEDLRWFSIDDEHIGEAKFAISEDAWERIKFFF